MTPDLDKLKALAEAVSSCRIVGIDHTQESRAVFALKTERGTLAYMGSAFGDFISACSPDVILALVEELEMARAERDHLKMERDNAITALAGRHKL